LDPNAPGTGLIQNDSFANCAAEGRRRENLVFETTPQSGTYLVYANLFDACGQDSVHFEVTLHVAVPGKQAGTFAVEETYRQAGELQAVHANGGAKLGMFVTSFNAH
jgi:nitrogen fixation protein FixH